MYNYLTRQGRLIIFYIIIPQSSFNDICVVLSDILNSNVLVISRKGKVLGVNNRLDIAEIQELIKDTVGRYIDSLLNERLLNILSTRRM